MDTQHLFDLLVAAVLAFVTFFGKTLWNDHKDTRARVNGVELDLGKNYRTKQEGDHILVTLNSRLERIANLELLLAQQYVSKVDVKDSFDELGLRLDRIEGKLDRKADK